MNLIYQELNRLVDDYYKCDVFDIKVQILCDINLLTEALIISEDEQEKGNINDLANGYSERTD